MRVTVAICTWNRPALLDRTLAALGDVRVPAGLGWEVVVVNNAGTAATDAVVLRNANRLPVRVVAEPTPGLSHARNRAVEESAGDLIVFTDDDVLVEPDWLAEYVAAAERFPAAGVFGGTVEPWFPAAPPRWVTRHLPRLADVFAVRRLGSGVRPLAPGEDVYGANMAFRRAALAGVRFDPNFGRTRDDMVNGEETDAIRRVLAAEWGGVWVGPARVRHYVPPERTTPGYVRRYFAGVGRTVQRRAGLPDAAVPRVFGAPRWMVRRYAAERVRAAVRSPLRDAAWFESLRVSAVLWGRMAECRALARKGAA